MNEIYNQSNIKTYQEHGILDSRAYIYHCVLCEVPASIDGSISMRGHKLICNTCAMNRFETLTDAFKWLEE